MTTSIGNKVQANTPRTMNNLPISNFTQQNILYGSALLKPGGAPFQCPGDIVFSTDGVTLTTTGTGSSAQASVKDGAITPAKLNVPSPAPSDQDVFVYDAASGAWTIGAQSVTDGSITPAKFNVPSPAPADQDVFVYDAASGAWTIGAQSGGSSSVTATTWSGGATFFYLLSFVTLPSGTGTQTAYVVPFPFFRQIGSGASAKLDMQSDTIVANDNFEGELGTSSTRNAAYVTSLDASTTVTAAGNVVTTGGYFDGALGASGDRDAAYVTSLDASTTVTAAGNVVSTGGYFDGVLGASGDRAAAYVTTLDASTTLEAPDIYGVTTNQVEIGAYGTTEGLKLGYDNGPTRGLITVYDSAGAFALLRVSASALVMNGGNFDGQLGASASASRNTAYVTTLDASGNVSTSGYFDGALGDSGDRDAAYVTSLDASTTLTAAGNVETTGGYFKGVVGASGDRSAIYASSLDVSGTTNFGTISGQLGAPGDRNAAYVTSLDASTTVTAAGNVVTTGGYFDGVLGASGDRDAAYVSTLDASGNISTSTFLDGQVGAIAIRNPIYASTIEASGNVSTSGYFDGTLGASGDRDTAYVTTLDANNVIKATGSDPVEVGSYSTTEGAKLGYITGTQSAILTAYDNLTSLTDIDIVGADILVDASQAGGGHNVNAKISGAYFKVEDTTGTSTQIMLKNNTSVTPGGHILLVNSAGSLLQGIYQTYSQGTNVGTWSFSQSYNSHTPLYVQAKTYFNYNDMSLKVGDGGGFTYLGAGTGIATWSNGTGNGNGRIHINQGNGRIGTGSITTPGFDFSADGTLGIYGASFNTPSDERYKTNITHSDLDACEQKVRNIELYDYEYIDQLNGSRKPNKAGFIAQQVQQVAPDCVNATEGVDPCVYAQRACALNADGKLVISGAALEDGVYEFYNSENETNISSCRYTIANNTVVEHEGVDPAKLGAWVFIVGICRDDMLSIPKDRVSQYLFGTVKNLLAKVDRLTARIEELESR